MPYKTLLASTALAAVVAVGLGAGSAMAAAKVCIHHVDAGKRADGTSASKHHWLSPKAALRHLANHELDTESAAFTRATCLNNSIGARK